MGVFLFKGAKMKYPNQDYKTALRGGKWVTQFEKKWLKNQIKDDQISGMIAGVCYILILLIGVMALIMGVINA
jgi:hypothetical protein